MRKLELQGSVGVLDVTFSFYFSSRAVSTSSSAVEHYQAQPSACCERAPHEEHLASPRLARGLVPLELAKKKKERKKY